MSTNFQNGIEIGGVAVTSTAAELNILDGVTSTAAELNILDGVVSTAVELDTVTVCVPLGTVADAATITGAFIADGAYELIAGEVVYHTKPASTSGTVVLALANYDLSAPAEDNLLSTSNIDLEAITDHTPVALTLTATAADLILADGDSVYATVTSDNADMTDGTGGTLRLEFQRQ